jgi:aryl-alcohol dehydrogenase-like predicted oxidoreductase|tara:strand:+ start:491 stop:1546 length:1056 start_codon:yes stop_codon:yes gene_type:complete
MNYRKLGNTDLEVSTICLGTMTWGEQNSQEDGFEQMDYASNQGINFFDTAEIYPSPCFKETYASTEKIIGNWLNKKKNRDKIILASKISGPGLSWVRGGGQQYTEQNIESALENSLRRLQTDYIDLYQLHWPERKTNFFGKLGYNYNEKETYNFKGEWTNFKKILTTLEKFIKQGKIRYIGLSNETPWGLSKFLEISKLKSLPKMMSIQNAYNLLSRAYEVGMAEISIREKSGLLAYSPLAGGFLTGKYRNNNLPENSRQKLFGNYYTRYNKPHASLVIEKYFNIAKKFAIDFAQMSIKFCEIQPFMTSVIIGATTMEQLKINIESVNVNLSDENITEINKIQKLYPNPCP